MFLKYLQQIIQLEYHHPYDPDIHIHFVEHMVRACVKVFFLLQASFANLYKSIEMQIPLEASKCKSNTGHMQLSMNSE